MLVFEKDEKAKASHSASVAAQHSEQPHRSNEARNIGFAQARQEPEIPRGVEARAPRNDKFGFLKRLRKIKHFEIYLAVGLIVVMIGIYMTTFGGGGGGGTAQRPTPQENFAREIETNLVRTLSQIRGAGRVEAMVTVVGSATIEVAYNIDERTVTQNGGSGSSTSTTTIVKTPVIISGRDGPQPLILFEIKPKVKGVIIIASGAYDVGVRLQLLRAVQAVLADDSVRIEIFTGR